MILTIRAFAGEQPRIAPSLLPEASGQVALDCDFSSGELRATRGLSDEVKVAGGLSNPTGFFTLDDGNIFTWTATGLTGVERTVAKSPVIGDFYERVYFTDGSEYLRVAQQADAIAGIGIWDPSATYASGNFVTYPGIVPDDYAAGTTYKQGDLVRYPVGAQSYPNNNIVYRALRDNNLAHTPDSNAAWWQLYGLGVKYISLQSSNTGKTPGEQPTWWRPYAKSLVGVTTRAGVPAPAAWTAKVFGAGTYNVNVVSGDLTGLLDIYHVPQAVADARAADDGSTTGVANTSALIAVARNTWISSLVLKASPTAAEDTGRAYYSASGVKQDEEVVTLYPIERARLYTFDPPVKRMNLNQYEVSQIWVESGNNSDIITVDLEHQGGD